MKNLYLLLIAIIGLLIFLLWNDKPTYIPSSSFVITKTDTFYKDTTIHHYHAGKNIPYKVIDTFYVDSGNKVSHDTLKICDKIRAYSDTFRIDSHLFTIKDTIRGEILGRGFSAFIKERTIVQEKTLVKPGRNQIFIGGIANPQYVGAGLFIVKGKQMYGISINSNQSVNLSYYVRIY